MNPKALGLAGGILWGVSLALITLVNVYTGYAPLFVHMIAECYPGYSTTLPGVLISLGYGFIDGFFGLFILAWLYNRFS